MKEDLQQAREQLDEIDRRFVEMLAQRQQVIDEVASLKASSGRDVHDPEREQALLARLRDRARELGLPSHLVEDLYTRILDHSVRHQIGRLVDRHPAGRDTGRLVVAYQGGAAAYSHLAARRHFEGRTDALACHGYASFHKVAEAVAEGEADCGLLPIENTTAGSINDTYDLLADGGLYIIGEEIVRIEHCLLTAEPVPLRLVQRIYSHPQALAQCSTFLASLDGCRVESYFDTALAARKVREDGDPAQAAIASRKAAEEYDLHVLREGVANQQENYTRFVVVARQPLACGVQVPSKTSLVFALPDRQGALMHALNVLATRGVNMTKVESRPRPHAPWTYRFYVDIDGNPAVEPVQEALEALEAVTRHLKILGTYPAQGLHAAGRLPAARARRAFEAPSEEVEQGEAPAVVVAKDHPYRLASRAHRSEDTRIAVGEVVLGGDTPVLIAGPCSVESREQIMTCAAAVREAGGHILRGGCFKPRTSPYSFQGLGYEGVDLLHEAGRRHGLPVITEVMHPSDVEAIAEQSDVLQIGARNMQNFALLKAVGQARRPVMLKRGMMASIDEWLAAAEYILDQGNAEVFLCERGIRTFETATRNTLDVSAVPVLRERTHLPVVVDPSHACGERRWVPPLAEAALAAGAHGVMVEMHPNPDEALSDGPQSLTFEAFEALAASLRARSAEAEVAS